MGNTSSENPLTIRYLKHRGIPHLVGGLAVGIACFMLNIYVHQFWGHYICLATMLIITGLEIFFHPHPNWRYWVKSGIDWLEWFLGVFCFYKLLLWIYWL